jgi:hypothetical protein
MTKGAVTYIIDYGDIIKAADIIDSAGEIINPRTKIGRKIRKEYFEWLSAAVEDDMIDVAKANADTIAHVYEWDSVVDRSDGTPSKSQKKSGWNDSANTFEPKVDSSARLWYMKQKGEGKNRYISQVMFSEAQYETVYDDAIYSLKWMNPSGLGRHVFHDQAENLEYTKAIIKKSSVVSSRRINSPGKRTEMRILQYSSATNSVINVENYSRENRFYRMFSQFFSEYVAANSVRVGDVVNRQLDAEIKKVFGARLATMSKFSKKAASTVIPAGMMLSFTGRSLKATPNRLTGANIIFTDGKNPITHINIPRINKSSPSPEAVAILRYIRAEKEKKANAARRGKKGR